MANALALVVFFGVIAAALVIVGVVGVLVVSLIVAAVKLLLFVILLPFRIFGLGLKIGFTAVGLAFRAVFLIAACLVLLLVGLVPLIPLVLVGGAIYFIVRALRPRAAPPVNV